MQEKEKGLDWEESCRQLQMNSATLEREIRTLNIKQEEMQCELEEAIQ